MPDVHNDPTLEVKVTATKKEVIVAFIKRRKIVVAITALLLYVLTQIPFFAEHYIVNVKYCEDVKDEKTCEVVSDNLFDAIDGFIEGSLEEQPEATSEGN